MAIQDELARKANKVGLGMTKQQLMNVLAGTTGRSLQDAANIYAGTTGRTVQGAMNIKVSKSGLSAHEACKLL
jgi:hypothetical protein